MYPAKFSGYGKNGSAADFFPAFNAVEVLGPTFCAGANAAVEHRRVARIIVDFIMVNNIVQYGREPGDFGFGTWYLEGKTEEDIKKIKYQEIMNGRLAMMAFGGVVTQSILFNVGFPYIGS